MTYVHVHQGFLVVQAVIWYTDAWGYCFRGRDFQMLGQPPQREERNENSGLESMLMEATLTSNIPENTRPKRWYINN
jgi:hypothetical protein